MKKNKINVSQLSTSDLVAALLQKERYERDSAFLILMKQRKLDFIHLSELYVQCLQDEENIGRINAIEGSTIIYQLLNKDTQKDKSVINRALHYYNRRTNLIPHFLDKEYAYTDADEEKQLSDFECRYGKDME